MDLSSYLSILQTIVVLLIVIALANLTLKYLNKHLKKQNKIIKVIERVSVNNNSALSIVEACGKYYLMSFTGTENKILKELDTEEIQYINELGISDTSLFDFSKNDKGCKFKFSKLGNLFEMRKKVD